MASIVNQNAYGSALPNFRNLGILLRILLIVNVAALAAALVKSATLHGMWNELLEISAVVQPLLILSLLALMALNGVLKRLPYRLGMLAVIVLELALTALLYAAARPLLTEAAPLQRYWLLVFIVTVMLLVYFDLRGRALSPALTEARLQALQARIRPHFLFNSINAVLSLIRQDPKRAEVALEDMADLFRVLMADNRELTPLAREVELCRQYLDLEQLRLGERLQSRVAYRQNAGGRADSPAGAAAAARERGLSRHRAAQPSPASSASTSTPPGSRCTLVLRNPYQHRGQPPRRQQDGARQHPRAAAAALRCRSQRCPARIGDERLSGAHRHPVREGEDDMSEAPQSWVVIVDDEAPARAACAICSPIARRRAARGRRRGGERPGRGGPAVIAARRRGAARYPHAGDGRHRSRAAPAEARAAAGGDFHHGLRCLRASAPSKCTRSTIC